MREGQGQQWQLPAQGAAPFDTRLGGSGTDLQAGILHVDACQASVRRGLSEARAELRDVAALDVIDAAIRTWQTEEARLAVLRRAVGLVEEALRGRRYVARL